MAGNWLQKNEGKQPNKPLNPGQKAAHFDGPEFTISHETSVPLISKEVLFETKKIRLPRVIIPSNARNKHINSKFN